MLAPKLQRNCLDTLRKICSRQGLLPRSVQIQLLYSRSDTPLYQGGFADIWKSQYQGYHVAVKVLRVCTSDNFRKITSVGPQKFFKVVYMAANAYNCRGFARRL